MRVLCFLLVLGLISTINTIRSISLPKVDSYTIQTKFKYNKRIGNIRRKMGQSISTSQWYVYGRRHFTQSGYKRHIKDYYQSVGNSSANGNGNIVQNSACIGRNVDGADGIDLEGKVVVVTGANSGIGKELATYAAAKGAKLYMLCRTLERAQKAKEEIIQSTKNQNIKIIQVDTGEPSQVREAAKELNSSETQIHCLICNAGALSNDKKFISDGKTEVTIASQLLYGSYLLSTLLLPKLENSAAATASDSGSNEESGPRVIYVSSGGMYNTKFPSWEEATNTAPNQKYDGVMTYAYAKRGQVILAKELAKQYPTIKWLSCHPGWVDTIGVEEAFGPNGKKLFAPLRTKWEGSEGIAWLMGTNGSNLVNGGFYMDRKEQPIHLAGPFMTEGSHTKNTDEEVDEFMKKLSQSILE